MAIDDNTVYGLTGAQIKELPELTSGNYKVLSDADVNYPTDNPTSIRACMLPNGIYFKPSGLTVNVGATLVGNYPISDNAVIIVAGATSGTNKWVIYASPSSYPPLALLVSNAGGLQYLGRMSQVIDNLTSTDTISALSANQGRVLDNKITALSNYSTSEVNTGATWIDGSIIYKKTISTGALPNATSKAVAHNISNLGAVVKFEGYATDGIHTLPLPLVATNSNYCVQLSVSSTDVELECVADRSGFTDSYVTLYYTKSS